MLSVLLCLRFQSLEGLFDLKIPELSQLTGHGIENERMFFLTYDKYLLILIAETY